MGTEVRAHGDTGQEVLQCRVFLAVQGSFFTLSLFEAEVVFQAQAYGFIEGELESLAAGRVGGDAAKEGIAGGGRVGHLGAKMRSRNCQGQQESRKLDPPGE